MIKLHVLAVLGLLFAGLLFFTVHGIKAEEQGFVRMYMVNPLTGTSDFNVSDLPVGSDFVVEFYIGNVTDLITWQIHLTYNRVLIHYAKAWFPEDSVFKQSTNRSAPPLAEVANNVDNESEIADLLVIMTSTYPPDSSPQFPVNVTSKQLLCRVNFTIASHPAFTQLDFVGTTTQSPHGLLIIPPYHLTNYSTSVETLHGTYPARGDPALICDTDLVSESLVLLLLMVALPAALILILTKRRRAPRGGIDRSQI